MKKITIFVFIGIFLLFRPYQIQNSSLTYVGDDDSYFAHSSAIVFGQFPDYSKEHFVMGETQPEHPIGASLMAVPFVFAGSLVDRALGSDIVIERTRGNVADSWSLFGFMIATNFYFWMACFLLFKGLRYYFDDKYASLAVICAVLAQGFLLYAVRRPVFSHTYEFFLQSLMVFLLLRKYSQKETKDFRPISVFCIGVAIGFITLVRYNNIFTSLFWPMILFGRPQRNNWRKFLSVYIIFSLVILCFKILPLSARAEGFNAVSNHLLTINSPEFYLKRIIHVFVGIDWGLIYTAPFIVIGLVSLFFSRFKLKPILLFALLPLAVNIFIVLQMKTQNCYYGYRHLIFSLTPLLVYPIALFIQKLDGKFGRKMYWLTAAICILPVVSFLCFEGNNSNLTLTFTELGFGQKSWGNLTYQLEVWKTLLFHPVNFLIAVLKGGALYVVYLFRVLLQIDHKLPAIVLQKYPQFELSILIKTIIIYLLPFVFYKITSRFMNKQDLKKQQYRINRNV